MTFMRTAMEHTGAPHAKDHDQGLIERAQAGDRQAFEELIFKYDRDILHLNVRLLRNWDEARDAYQETFLKVFRSIHQFRRQSSFYTWIFRIATNVCLDRLRQERTPGNRSRSIVKPAMLFGVLLNIPFEARVVTATLNNRFSQRSWGSGLIERSIPCQRKSGSSSN